MSRSFRIATGAVCLVTVGLLLSPPTLYSLDTIQTAPQDDPTIIYGEPIHDGIVVSGSDVLEGPYRIASQGQKILVNGRTVALLSGGERRRERIEEMGKDFVATLERGLFAGGAFLAFDQDTWMFMEMEEEAGQFLHALLEDEGVEARVQTALGFRGNEYFVGSTYTKGLNPKIPTSQWRTALEAFESNDSLTALFDNAAVYDMPAGESSAAYVARDPTCWMYALNLTGMLLAVVSCGVLIGHRPETGFRWGKIIESASADRLMQYSMLLIVALSVFDLIATLLASSTGGFIELNPMAGSLMGNPLGLAAFKLILTGMSAGILWYRREYAFAQQAAWWVCLLLTLVTMRWVTVQSLFYV